MYIDLIILMVLMLVVVIFFKRFSSFVFFIAIVDIFLRILTFIKNNIGLYDIKKIINKYLPESIFGIIDSYCTGTINLLFKWAFVILMCIFLGYITKIFIKKKRI